LNLLRLLFGKGEGSSEVAKKRLKLVIMHDRTDVSPEVLRSLRADLVELLNRYLVIDEEHIGIELMQDQRSVALVANIPIKGVRRG